MHRGQLPNVQVAKSPAGLQCARILAGCFDVGVDAFRTLGCRRRVLPCGTVVARQPAQFRQRDNVALHAEDAVHHDEFSRRRVDLL